MEEKARELRITLTSCDGGRLVKVDFQGEISSKRLHAVAACEGVGDIFSMEVSSEGNPGKFSIMIGRGFEPQLFFILASLSPSFDQEESSGVVTADEESADSKEETQD